MLIFMLDTKDTKVNGYTGVYNAVKKIVMQTDDTNTIVVMFSYKTQCILEDP